jgi:DNA topoisomerase-1
VNDYLRDASGGTFTAKDFRTWFATLEALTLLRKERARNSNEARKQVLATVKAVSAKLGNTPAVCRKWYIHPEVLSAHEGGRLSLLGAASAPLALRKLLAPARRSRKSRKNPTHGIAAQSRRPQRTLTATTSTPA